MNVRLILRPLWITYILALGVLYLTIPVSPDQALFDYIAWSNIQGDHYYTGVAEQNWPGKMILHELGIRLFGVHFWTFRAIDFAFLVLVTTGGAILLRNAEYRLGGIVFLFLYPVLYVTSGFWQAGQRDIVAAGLLVIAAALARPGSLALWPFFSGVTVGMAVLIRPTYLSYLVGLMSLEWITFRGENAQRTPKALGRTAALGLGFALPITALVVIGLTTGSLDDFYEQTILFNLQSYQIEQSRSRLWAFLAQNVRRDWHWIAALAVLGVILWLVQKGSGRTLILILGLAATVLLSYFTQNKGWGYHLGGLIVVFALLSAAAIDCLDQIRKDAASRVLRLAATGGLAAVVLLCMAGSTKKVLNFQDNIGALMAGEWRPQDDEDHPSWKDTSQAVALIQAHSPPDSFVLQWGRNFQIPYLAVRRTTLRFVSTPALEIMTPSFAAHDAWLAEIGRDLETKRPFFALVDKEMAPEGQIAPRSGAGPAERLVVEALLPYEVVMTTDHFVLLRAP